MHTMLLEHGDFSNAKRGLIAASIGLVVVSHLDLQSDHIELFKLQLGVEQSSLVLFARLAVAYFIYIFAVRAWIQFRLESAANIETVFELGKRKISEKIKEVVAEHDDIDKLKKTISKASKSSTSAAAHMHSFDIRVANTMAARVSAVLLGEATKVILAKLLTDYLPAPAIAFLSLFFSTNPEIDTDQTFVLSLGDFAIIILLPVMTTVLLTFAVTRAVVRRRTMSSTPVNLSSAT